MFSYEIVIVRPTFRRNMIRVNSYCIFCCYYFFIFCLYICFYICYYYYKILYRALKN